MVFCPLFWQKVLESYINKGNEKKVAEPKGTEKLMAGLQITGPSFQVIQLTIGPAFRGRGNRPSCTINYSFCPLSFLQGYKTKALSWNCGWNRRKESHPLSGSLKQNTCRGLLVTDPVTARTSLAEVFAELIIELLRTRAIMAGFT